MKKIILVAGATGNLGERIVNALLSLNADVRIVVRENSHTNLPENFKKMGVEIYKIEHWNIEELSKACEDVSCVVSALAGLEDVIINAQKTLLDAAILSHVPRFIPSDYSLDFTKFTNGENRNLDLRRDFHAYIDNTKITTTSIFNGAFSELITNEMPCIFFKKRIVMYWGKKDHKWGFTTMDNVAEYTAHVALDNSSPRYLRIAGDLISPKEIKETVSEITGSNFKLLSPGGSKLLGLIIKITKKLSPGNKELYPAWQGMQYMHNMIDSRSKINQLNNNRYPSVKWTSIKDVLIKHQEKPRKY